MRLLYLSNIMVNTGHVFLHKHLPHAHTQKVVDALDPATYVTQSELKDALSTALQQHEEVLKQHSASIESQSEGLSQTEKALRETSNLVSQLDDKVGGMSEQLSELVEKIKALEVCCVCVCVCVCCLLYTSPSPRDATLSRMPSSA